MNRPTPREARRGLARLRSGGTATAWQPSAEAVLTTRQVLAYATWLATNYLQPRLHGNTYSKTHNT